MTFGSKTCAQAYNISVSESPALEIRETGPVKIQIGVQERSSRRNVASAKGKDAVSRYTDQKNKEEQYEGQITRHGS